LAGDGVDDLRRLVSDRLSSGNRVRTLSVPVGDGAGLAWLHANGEVIGQEVEDQAMIVEVRLSDKDLARFEAR
jgi:GTP-binding protein HflX